MRTSGSRIIAVLALALVAASCTVTDTEAPDLAGPSELALSLHVQAVPDTVVQDGVSQSGITIEARGPSSQPVSGATFRVDTKVDGAVADFGTLSARTVVTSDDGRARVTYTAPPRPLPGSPATTVTIVVTPIGADYRGATPREIDLRVIPPGVILPPSRIDAKFVYSPAVVTAFQAITFDASTTTDNGVVCGANCTYSWNFGDGGSASGITTTHEFRTAGSFIVTLRVTNPSGQTGQLPQTIQVAAGTPPTAEFTFSPTEPGIQQDVFFNASASRAAAGTGRSIVRYDWDFGNGRTASGVTTSRRFDLAGSYVVTLSVTDDASQIGTTSKTVTVGTPGTGLVASLAFSPTTPLPLETVYFDGRASHGPSPIVRYQFDFGGPTDPPGSDVQNTSGISSRRFTAPGTYLVRLTVFDSNGRTATTTTSVAVGSAAPTAALVFSPTTPTTATNVVLDARGSSGRNPIVQYSFDFGGPVANCTGPLSNASGTASCRYTSAGSFVARVTVTESTGLTGTATASVTVTTP